MTSIWYDPIEEAQARSMTTLNIGLVVEADMEITHAEPEPEPPAEEAAPTEETE